MAAAANDTYEETIDDQPSSMFDVAYPSSSIFDIDSPRILTNSKDKPLSEVPYDAVGLQEQEDLSKSNITVEKSRYELIRDEIIAERNSQLAAIGFHEELAALKSLAYKQQHNKPQRKPPLVKHEFSYFTRRSKRHSSLSSSADVSTEDDSNFSIKSNSIKPLIVTVVLDANDREFKCELCQECFSDRRSMIRHTKSIHRKITCNCCETCEESKFSTKKPKHQTKKYRKVKKRQNKMSIRDSEIAEFSGDNKILVENASFQQKMKAPAPYVSDSCDSEGEDVEIYLDSNILSITVEVSSDDDDNTEIE